MASESPDTNNLAFSDDARFHLAAIVESSDDAIIGENLNGVVLSWNKSAERMFGYAAAEIIGLPITKIFLTEQLIEEAFILNKIRSGRTIDHLETQRRRKDGILVPVSISVSPIFDGYDNIIGVSTFIRDLTEHRKREQKIAELQSELIHVSRLNELGLMAAAISHEVTQPLSAIANYTYAAKQLLSTGNQEGAFQVLEKVAEQTSRAAAIVKKIYDFTQKRPTLQQVENLTQTIEEATGLALLGVEPTVELVVQIDVDANEAVIDKVQLQQVLINLIRNAVEAMAFSDRRELQIDVVRIGNMVEISVADTGTGLTDNVRARLFEPFVTTKAHGMGVGLSVCRTIIEAHGGILRVKDAEGGGAAFCVTVPHPVFYL